ncbi:MAG: ABC transporter substrate-binding protein [Chloroflexota bacterium]
MSIRTSLLPVVCLTVLGLVLASCAPAVAPTPTPKPAAPGAPAAKPATPKPAAPAAKPATPAPAAPAPTPKPAAEKPSYGGVLNISHTGDTPTYDLHQESSIISLAVLSLAYNMLIQYDPLEHTKIVADLAEKWEVSKDGLLYTFNLRKDVKWHDDKPFTSADAKFSLDRMIFPPKGVRAPRQPHFLAVDRFEAPDPHTVKVYMKYPSASFIPMLATGWMVICPKHVIEEKGDMKKVVMGTGPFKEKRITAGTSYEWQKNPDYFMKGRPYLDGITFYVVKDRGTRFAAFRTGQVLIYGIGETMTVTQAKLVERDMPNARVETFMAYNTHDFDMNCTKPPFNDVRVRQAVSMAVDRQAAVQVLAEGDAVVGPHMPPGGLWALPNEELLNMPGFRQPKDADRAQAKKLLAEAGYPGGLKTTLMVKSREPEVAEFMQAQLATIGIDATIDIRETGDWTQRAVKGMHDAVPLRISLKLDDPEDIGRYHLTSAIGGQNYAHFSSKEIDDLFVKQSQAMDPAERKKITWELQRKLIEQAPKLKLDWFYYKKGIRKEVRDYKPGPGNYCNNKWEVVWLSK